jgi:hypothetical protein
LLETKLQGFMEGNNLGGALNIYKNRTGNFLNFKTIEAGDGMLLVDDGEVITINALRQISLIIDTKYVSQTADVDDEIRDGSFDRPFKFIQDAVDAFGAPVDIDDYNRQVSIIILDRAVYNETLNLFTRRYFFSFQGGTPTGNWNVNINNASRFGSSFNPTIDFYSSTRNLGTQFIGNLTWKLASGGTPVTNIALRFVNINWTGNVTIADGTNGGTSVTSSTNSQVTLVNSAITGTFLGRNTSFSLQNSSIVGNVEAQSVLSSSDASLNGSTIRLYGTSTLNRQISDLRLNTAGVAWQNVSVGPRWVTDEITSRNIALYATVTGIVFVFQGRLPALTAANNTVLTTELAAFPNTLAVINNLRTRQAEIEARLRSCNLIS